ncbi:hypothetical protein Tco_1243482 [Tanacetum coccineum]
MKMTSIMNMTLEVKEVIKKETVVMTRPNLTVKKGRNPSMKLIRMNRAPNLIKEENEEEDETDEEEKNDKFVRTLSNDIDDEDETKIKDKAEGEGDKDEGMDYTTNQFDDDVNVSLNEPVDTDEGLIQKEGNDAEMTNVQQGNENLEITQVIKDTHVTLSTVSQKTKVPQSNTYTLPVSVITESSPIFTTVILQSLPSFTPPPQQLTQTPPPTTKATNPPSTLPNFESVFQFDNRVTSLEKEVAKLKRNDPLNTQVTTLVDEYLESRLGATRDEFMSFLSASITARITEQVKNQLPQILPKEVSNFAPPVIQSTVIKSLKHAVVAKESSQPKSTYEAASSLT